MRMRHSPSRNNQADDDDDTGQQLLFHRNHSCPVPLLHSQNEDDVVEVTDATTTAPTQSLAGSYSTDSIVPPPKSTTTTDGKLRATNHQEAHQAHHDDHHDDHHDNHHHDQRLCMWNWCAHFVVPLQLCPWAARSVTRPEAMIRFYWIDHADQWETTLQRAAKDFVDTVVMSSLSLSSSSLLRPNDNYHDHDNNNNDNNNNNNNTNNNNNNDDDNHPPTVDQDASIFFVVLVDPSSPHFTDFNVFYDWYVEMEDDWLDVAEQQSQDDRDNVHSLVTLAPFHPDWTYDEDDYDDDYDNDDNDGNEPEQDDTVDDPNDPDEHKPWRNPLDVEKQSPYPAVSIVSTRTIDRAGGPAITQRIAQANQEQLQRHPYAYWKKLYEQAIIMSNALPEEE